MENTVHREWSGLHMKCPIQGNFICQGCVRMWAAIPLAKDIDFAWALWYRKCPRSLYRGGHFFSGAMGPLSRSKLRALSGHDATNNSQGAKLKKVHY